jgi:AcrR family transcriptional regulator
MTETPSKREQLKEERRRQILDAALEVFAQKGYSAANVSDVAARAGVSQGTIYWYFDSKEELFTAAIRTLFDSLDQEAFVALAQCATAADKLRALGQTMAQFAESAGALLMRFLEVWAAGLDREGEENTWIDLLRQYRDVIVGIIEEGVKNGEFGPVDAGSLVWALLAAYDGLAAYAVFMPDLDLGRISQAFVGALLTGLEIKEMDRNGRQR